MLFNVIQQIMLIGVRQGWIATALPAKAAHNVDPFRQQI